MKKSTQKKRQWIVKAISLTVCYLCIATQGAQAQIKSPNYTKVHKAAKFNNTNLILAGIKVTIIPNNPVLINGSGTLWAKYDRTYEVFDSWKWFKNGVLIPNENSLNLSVFSTGSYQVSVDFKINEKLYTIKSDAAIVTVASATPPPPPPITTAGVTIKNLQVSGINYKLYEPSSASYPTPKGIVVIGSGNDGNNPSIGSLSGTTENDLCKMAAENGYVAAVIAYQAGTPNPNNGSWAFWDNNAKLIAQDFDKCITDLSSRYNVPKSKAVIAGVSYTSFSMLTAIAIDNTLSYAAGLIATCGGTDTWKAQNFKIPVYSITCLNSGDGEFSGLALYNQIPASSPIKARSEGHTDATCIGHCKGNWVQLMFNKVKMWVP
jgi:hypothetical protein